MAKLLDRIQSGKTDAPRRVLLYGSHGIGKSTFAAMAERPVFIQTEDGLGRIDCRRFPLAKAYGDVLAALVALYSEKHDFRTVVIDSLEWLEQLIWAEVCAKRTVQSIEEIGYAKGYVYALTQWREILEGLSALRDQRGMTVLLIAHCKIERYENPETDSYDRYVPRLNKHASALIQEWCDEVLFVTYDVLTKTTREGFDRTRVQGISTGRRIIITAERPSHVAKNRLRLPYKIPLKWSIYAALAKGRPVDLQDTACWQDDDAASSGAKSQKPHPQPKGA